MQGSRLFLILALASVAAPALADWKQDYARGVEAALESSERVALEILSA